MPEHLQHNVHSPVWHCLLRSCCTDSKFCMCRATFLAQAYSHGQSAWLPEAQCTSHVREAPSQPSHGASVEGRNQQAGAAHTEVSIDCERCLKYMLSRQMQMSATLHTTSAQPTNHFMSAHHSHVFGGVHGSCTSVHAIASTCNELALQMCCKTLLLDARHCLHAGSLPAAAVITVTFYPQLLQIVDVVRTTANHFHRCHLHLRYACLTHHTYIPVCGSLVATPTWAGLRLKFYIDTL